MRAAACWLAVLLLGPCALARPAGAGEDDRWRIVSPRPAPRRTEPDSAARARADSLRLAHPVPPGAGTRALAIGLAATFVPAAVALPIATRRDAPEAAPLVFATAFGIIAGPAVGLASGGRGDLATRGLVLRGALLVGVAGAGLAWGSALDRVGGDSGPAVIMAEFLGLVAAGWCVASDIRDLAITPSAVRQGRPYAVVVGADARGRLVATLRF